MKIVHVRELIDGMPVSMGKDSLEDSVANRFRVGEIIEQTRVIPGVSQVGSSIPITNAIISTKKYKVTEVQENKSETGTPILTVTMKEIT